MARILIAEPDDEVRRLLAQIVEGLGHDAVTWDCTGVDAADAAADGAVDVLLLDPDCRNALTFGEEARTRNRTLPVICMSFRAPSPRAQRLHPLACLRKPFAADTLETLLLAATRPAIDVPS